MSGRTAAPLTPGAAEHVERARRSDRAAIRRALVAAGGNVTRAAIDLGVARRTLDQRIVTLGLREWLTERYPRSVRQPKRNVLA